MSGPRAVLVGPPGSGKTTVGTLLARAWGVEFRDTDADIAAAAGRSIPEIFIEDGEDAFRALERDAVVAALAEHRGVLALGGGSILHPATRADLAGLPVVFLDVSLAHAAPRVGLAASRPLLVGNPRARWQALMDARRGLYEEVATLVVSTDGLTPEAAAERVLAQLGVQPGAAQPGVATREPTRITVRAEHEYDVVIGRGLLGEIPELVGPRATRVLVMHPAELEGIAEAVRTQLAARGYEALLMLAPDAEDAKTSEYAASCWAALGRAAFSREDVVVGIGGGATTDVAGFVAATWLRGVPVIQVPTTLLAMVDAAVGGKTGINTAEGKNLVGAFHSPRGVLCDLGTLETLPAEDLRAGLAEVAKCGFIADERILELIEEGAGPDAASPVLAELIERSVAVKARVVSADLREASLREILNYGHTLGHAIEHVEHYRWRHGEAVAVGMVVAAALGRLTGRLSESDVERHRSVLRSLGLPVTYTGGRWPELLEAMRRDKKTRRGALRFVVLDGVGRPGRLEDPEPDLLTTAYARISA